jgi:hypothetical protein
MSARWRNGAAAQNNRMTVLAAFDLQEPFSLSSERLYFAIDGHFNPAGHRCVAQLLAAWLNQTVLPKDS